MANNNYLELLKQAWREVFGVEEVSDDADFFSEGGDSIKAVQLSSWLIQKGLKLDLGTVFSSPVLSQMAETLEETEPVYVPEELMTKEKVGELMQKANQTSGGNQQAFSPAQMPKPGAASYQEQQICDPEQMLKPDAAPYQEQQICDPEQMPKPGAAMPSFDRGAEWNTMLSMFQTMMAQQQVMLQMMQMMMSRMMMPAAPKMPQVPGMIGKPFGKKHRAPVNPPENVQAAFQQQMEKFVSKKVDAPIDKPNVIGIQPAKVTKPQASAAEVLDHVLSGLLKNGYNKVDDLFAQGLTSLDTVKLVTRCGEHGYALSMKDIYMHSTYDELLNCMKPGK